MATPESIQVTCSPPVDGCQHQRPQSFARLRRPWAVLIALVFLKRLWRQGFTGIPCAALRVLRHRWGTGVALAPLSPIPDEVLRLQPGELVEVKSEAEIQSTLDLYGRLRGLAFLQGMIPCCGRRFRVYKRLKLLFWEESGRQRRMENTVLLAGSICDGAGIGCDRSCLYFWREAWLRRVPEEPAQEAGSLSPFPILPETRNRAHGGAQ